ncbi:MAG: DUF1566 domain-containing protein [Nitrospinota bacterium]|nr:DUF1566 domain-containing protein [Nitrospinota bacterium]
MNKTAFCFLASCLMGVIIFASGCAKKENSNSSSGGPGAAMVDTGQTSCYDDNGPAKCPARGEPFHGQDAQYFSTQMSYQDNGDGTVSDLVTGLMWQKTYGAKTSLDAALAAASSQNTGGYNDWRVPTIKELYSLMNFEGVRGDGAADSTPFINTAYFDFAYGNTAAGERFIDAQYLSSTTYVGTTMNGDATVFGVNFADGRIKGYPRYATANPGPAGGQGAGGNMFIRYVRGGQSGANSFKDNGDQTITDNATGLTWLKGDSVSMGAGTLNWQSALAWCENLDFAGRTDWRLPNAKELQAIVDYSRSPSTTGSAAIDPIFMASRITVEQGNSDFAFYWTGTTHVESPAYGSYAVYIAFGTAYGYMQGRLMDVHGAGCQRSDPKSGDPGQYPQGHGPQGDVIRIYNLARCVAGGV